ncbi:MAG: hypothetical protein WC747_04330 [Candidatus Babeliales bacterium]|jgi:hypothetical protein
MILSSQTNASDVEEMLQFYKQQFAVVEVVSCGKCGSFLAFECSGGESMGLAPNELGKYIIPIGDNLLSHRVRLDEAPTGERMVGYQCGALVPNPAYPIAVADHQAAVAAYEAQYPKDVAAYEKDFKKTVASMKKTGQPEPEHLPPAYNPPAMPPVAEQIECGNDTRIAAVERGIVPVGGLQTTLSPFERHQIRERLRADRKHKPDFKKVGNIKHFESFQVERV